MEKCKGIFGYLFGHKYVSMIKEVTPPESVLDIQAHFLTPIMKTLSKKVYVVCCKRCGKRCK